MKDACGFLKMERVAPESESVRRQRGLSGEAERQTGKVIHSQQEQLPDCHMPKGHSKRCMGVYASPEGSPWTDGKQGELAVRAEREIRAASYHQHTTLPEG